MKFLLILGALVAVATASTKFAELVLEEWNTFRVTHNKSFYNDAQDKFRMKVFMQNRIHIAKHNARYARGEVSFELGINHFTDLTLREVVDMVNGFNRTARKGGVAYTAGAAPVPIPRSAFQPSSIEIPDSIDWRKRGAVTPVKNQGQCGSCYSFSATGALEGQTFLKIGRLVSLSEQNILDCSTSYGNQGCSGGLMDNAFSYIRDNKGLDTEASYPYEGKDESCHYNASAKGATDNGLVDIPAGDEEALKNAVATIGPISVAIDAGHQSMVAYKSGVYYESECNGQSLDHAVLVVGYGTDENGNDYWLIKNSWGTHWGEDGYIRMARNRNNHCGIANQASYPVV